MDTGQKLFPHDDIICPVCNYHYVPSILSDITLHRKFHREFIHGIVTYKLQSDNGIFSDNGFSIIVITPDSPKVQKNRAQRIAARAKIRTDYSYLSYRADEICNNGSPLVFVGIVNNHTVAMVVFRKVNSTMKISWNSYENRDYSSVEIDSQERWCVAMIWTLESKRRKGYAANLLLQASKYVSCDPSKIAWSLPFSPYGEAFARGMFPDEIVLPTIFYP